MNALALPISNACWNGEWRRHPDDANNDDDH
jgi:hypothetical protein